MTITHGVVGIGSDSKRDTTSHNDPMKFENAVLAAPNGTGAIVQDGPVEKRHLRGLALVDPEIRRQIGRLGGESVARKRGSEYFSQIGRKGGRVVSQNREHMAEIGREGGRSRGRAHAAAESVQEQ